VVVINIIAVLLLIIGQTLPRALSAAHPEMSSGSLLGFARVIAVLVKPIEALGDISNDLLTRLLGGEDRYHAGGRGGRNAAAQPGGLPRTMPSSPRSGR
jgi:Mg2+/Co2+ transporter CorB